MNKLANLKLPSFLNNNFGYHEEKWSSMRSCRYDVRGRLCSVWGILGRYGDWCDAPKGKEGWWLGGTGGQWWDCPSLMSSPRYFIIAISCLCCAARTLRRARLSSSSTSPVFFCKNIQSCLHLIFALTACCGSWKGYRCYRLILLVFFFVFFFTPSIIYLSIYSPDVSLDLSDYHGLWTYCTVTTKQVLH